MWKKKNTAAEEDEESESEVKPEGPREWFIIERAREQTTNVPH